MSASRKLQVLEDNQNSATSRQEMIRQQNLKEYTDFYETVIESKNVEILGLNKESAIRRSLILILAIARFKPSLKFKDQTVILKKQFLEIVQKNSEINGPELDLNIEAEWENFLKNGFIEDKKLGGVHVLSWIPDLDPKDQYLMMYWS